MENDQTSKDEVKTEASEQTSEPTSDDKPEETAGEQATPEKEEIDYKVKYSESSKEALRLLDETKRLQAEIESRQEKEKERDAELQRLREENEALSGENPEQYDTVKLKQTVEEVKKQVLLDKEERELNNFIQDNPQAKEQKEALRKLGRLSKSSYKDIWAEHFKPVYDRIEEKKSAVQSEKGSMSEEPSSNVELEEINKMPLEKRKAYFKKKGL